MSKIFQKFIADLKEKEFIPLKILEFISMAALFSFYPFLSIHARSIGITEGQYGVIAILVPFIIFPIPGMTGMLADKIGNFKWFLCATLILNGMSALLYLTLPRMETRMTNMNTTFVEFHCDMVDSLIPKDESPMIYYNGNEESGNQCNYDCVLLRDGGNPNDTEENLCKITKTCQGHHQNISGMVDDFDMKGYYTIEAEAYRYNSTHFIITADQCTTTMKIQPLRTDILNDSSCWYPCAGNFDEFNAAEEVITDYYIISLYTIYRIVNGICVASSFPLLMSAIISVLKNKDGDLGFQRIYGKIGIIIFTPMTGVLIDYFSTGGNQNYSPAFYIYFGLNCVSAMTVVLLDLKFKPPSKAIFSEVKEMLKNFEVALLISTCIIIGIALGVLDTFFFWLLEDLGANKSLMGITITVGSVSGIIIFFFASEIIYKFGCANCISFAIAAIAVRLLGYSMITNPWWTMPFETMEAFTMSLLYVSVITHGSVLSTQTTLATMQSILLGVLQSVGRGFGSLIGGFMIGAIGIQTSFQVMSLVCAVTCVVYTLINKCAIKRKATSMNQTDYNDKRSKNSTQIIQNLANA